MKKNITLLLFLLLSGLAAARPHTSHTDTAGTGKCLTSSYAIARQLLDRTEPEFAYRSGMTRRQLRRWQKGVSRSMRRLMRFPSPAKDAPAPVCLKSEPREGYTLEKWEFYPFPNCAATFLVLKPDGGGPRPAVLCIPGSGRTKEGLAGEPGIRSDFTEDYTDPKVCMALDMVREGYVAVAVDNAAAGEAADMSEGCRGYDYDLVARILLELDWSWLGYTSYLDALVLDWMRQQPYIRKDRIVVSGFSLGTEPMMVLGALNPDIFAFVYNDFLCHTQERALVLNRPGAGGRRPFPNSIRHLIPGYWRYFNFPDVAASLAPRPIIFTEGGLDRDFRLVRSAYADFGASDNAECHHYAKYADPAARSGIERMPEGIDGPTFFRLANVDPPSHYFKHELVLPWLRRILREADR